MGLIGLIAASAAVAWYSLAFRFDFHRMLTYHRVEPRWLGWELPAATAACAIAAVVVTRSARRARWVLVGSAWVVAAIPISVTGLLWYDHGENGPHDRDVGGGHLHEIGLGLLLYSLDHGHALPPDFPTLVRSVGMGQAAFVGCDYYGTTTDVTDPDRVARMIVQPQYCAFTYVGGGMRDDVPGDTVVAFSRSIDDNGGGSVLFADGHADWVCGPVAQYLIDHARPGGRPVVWSEVRAAIDRAYPGQHLTGDAN